MKHSTDVLPSPTKFDVPESMFEVNKESSVKISEISALATYEKVSVRVKAVAEEDPVEVKKGLGLQILLDL